MSHKRLLSLSLLTIVLQGCGDTPDEKKLKRRNDELKQLNQELSTEKEQTVAERDDAIRKGAATANELAQAQKELDQAKKDLSQAQKDKTAAEASSAKLEGELATQEKTVAGLNETIEAKEALISDKEAEIARLTSELDAAARNPELERARTELKHLKEERDSLKVALEQAQASANGTRKELQNARSRIAELEKQLSDILQKSVENVRGLWINEDEVSLITDSACYEMVHVASNGTFSQAIACGDGRVQIQTHGFERFSAQSVPEQLDNDYVGAYGFVIDGKAVSSSCQDPAASLLTSGDRLIFEMTRQDFGTDYGHLMSRNMVVARGEAFQGFTNASLNFADNKLDYEAMLAIASRSNAGPLSKSAAAFLGGLRGQGANVRLGCFDANGVFTATSSN
jgi:uncharacterized coiled-coil protein SlyX